MIHRTREQWISLLSQHRNRFIADLDPEKEFDSGLKIYAYLSHFIKPGGTLLDYGCGSGRIAFGLLEENVQYIGIDCNADNIDFCQHVFKPWNHCTFIYVNAKNGLYNPEGEVHVPIPLENESVDLISAGSVYTHFSSLEECEHYLDEMYRILKPKGELQCTWFRFPPNTLNTPNNDGGRSVFRESDILSMISNRFVIKGTSNGATSEHHDQWCLSCVKRS